MRRQRPAFPRSRLRRDRPELGLRGGCRHDRGNRFTDEPHHIFASTGWPMGTWPNLCDHQPNRLDPPSDEVKNDAWGAPHAPESSGSDRAAHKAHVTCSRPDGGKAPGAHDKRRVLQPPDRAPNQDRAPSPRSDEVPATLVSRGVLRGESLPRLDRGGGGEGRFFHSNRAWRDAPSPARFARARAAHLVGGAAHRLDDVLIAGAAAEIGRRARRANPRR